MLNTILFTAILTFNDFADNIISRPIPVIVFGISQSFYSSITASTRCDFDKIYFIPTHCLYPLNLPDNLPDFLSQHIFPLYNLLNLGVEFDNIDLLPLVLLLHIGGDRKVEVVCFDLLKRGKVREMRDLRAFYVGVYDAVDVLGRQLVVIRDLDAFL